ncbi:unnamed protein product [Sphenostylis stenocarpa]|uniref:Uncharacterized protein n=1 Tax=Sphenostylis stenocarpa TaxID=92480 RepID=A0AA86TAA6_9FABA|nr:unnamed protein product [Sphenostylis stenocarpa]
MTDLMGDEEGVAQWDEARTKAGLLQETKRDSGSHFLHRRINKATPTRQFHLPIRHM